MIQFALYFKHFTCKPILYMQQYYTQVNIHLGLYLFYAVGDIVRARMFIII